MNCIRNAARYLARFGLACALGIAGWAGAQTYPVRPVTLVVPFPAGGVTDAGARLIARKLGEDLKQPVVVDNRAGAGGSIGTKLVAVAAPDGYTLLLGTLATQVINSAVYRQSLSYDPQRDFASVYGVMAVPLVVVTRPDRPYKSFAALIEAARAKPGAISFGSPGTGTAGHLSAELLESVTGINLLHVPFKGSAAAINDLLGGSIDLAFDYASSTAAHVDAGKLVALAVTGDSRLASLPNVPTLRELGFANAEVTAWLGLFAPAATPQPAIERLRQAMDRIMRDPEVKDGLGKLGGQPMPLGPSQLTAFIQAEHRRWKPVVEKAGIKPD